MDPVLERRLQRIERVIGLRPPEHLLPSGWDVYGHYWGDWEEPSDAAPDDRPQHDD